MRETAPLWRGFQPRVLRCNTTASSSEATAFGACAIALVTLPHVTTTREVATVRKMPTQTRFTVATKSNKLQARQIALLSPSTKYELLSSNNLRVTARNP